MHNKKILALIVIFALFLCFSISILQIGIFPNINIENKQIFDIRLTPYDPNNLKKIETGISYEIEQSPTPPLPGVFAIGMEIKIYGTGDDGLRLRINPGTDQEILYIAKENTKYLIIDGPDVTDSLVWWKIQAVNEGSEAGWSVQDYFSAALEN
jgi:hypothetical protein